MRRWSSRRIGLPAPGTMSAPAKAPHPAGVPCIALAHRSDSVSDPLVGFGPPTRYFPKSPPVAFRSTGTSPGVLRPYSALGEGSPRLASCPVEHPGFAGIASASPNPPTTVPLTGFPNLSAAFFLPPPSCHFQTGGARGVPPFRGLFLPRSPDDSSPPACPLDVPPVGWPSPA
jgi:hypothetical protein